LCFVLIHFVGVFKNLGGSLSAPISAAYHFRQGVRRARLFWGRASTKIGDVKMDRHDQELLDKQMRRLSAPRNNGAIAVMLAAMFLVNVAIGGVVLPYQSEPPQIASIE
jgi:hypothetical protein